MVAAEAASAGALPVSAAHSGAAEVSQALAADLPDAARHLVSFELSDDAVEAIAARLRAGSGSTSRIASRPAPRCARPSSGCGAGSRSPAG